jgi:hypothetical protein
VVLQGDYDLVLQPQNDYDRKASVHQMPKEQLVVEEHEEDYHHEYQDEFHPQVHQEGQHFLFE